MFVHRGVGCVCSQGCRMYICVFVHRGVGCIYVCLFTGV